MKTLSIIMIIFLLSACGQTTTKKKSTTSTGTNGKVLISGSTNLTYCPVNYVVSYNNTDQMVTQLKVKGCLGSGAGCSVTDYRAVEQSIKTFTSLYPYQTTCKTTDGENVWEIHLTDFNDEYAQIMSILNAE